MKEIKEKSTSLKNFKKLTKEELRQITSQQHVSVPKFYGLPKIHKNGIPLRPIVDFRTSPAYKLSFFLNKILKLLTKNHPTSLLNTYDFVKHVKNLIIPPDYKMTSIHVTSLFTKVPLTVTLQYINEQLQEMPQEWKTITSLRASDVIDLIILCTKCNFFIWNDHIFKQTDGSPMGSPISPVLAEIFLQKLETYKLPNPNIFFYRRFVDDIFT